MCTIEALDEVLGAHLDYVILTYTILLYLPIFVAVHLLVLRGELSCAITEGQAALSTLSLHAIHILLGELLLGFTLIMVSSHTDNDVAIPAVLAHFSPVTLLLCELFGIARLEIIISIIPELNINGLSAFHSHCIEWFFLVVCLCLGEMLFGLFGEAELEMSAFEVQHFFLFYALLGRALVGELSLLFRVVVPLVASQTDIGAIAASISGDG